MLITLNHLKSSLQAVKTYINNVLPKKVSDLVDDSGHYTKPSGGIPASDLADGVVPVEDVQVNGTSIVADGVANVPIAKNKLGAVLISGNSAYGLKIGSTDGILQVVPATSTQIKTTANYIYPIPVKFQHESTFYGLAKAAGDTTQSSSNNAVGNYTDSAKTAIKNMLGVPEDPLAVGTALPASADLNSYTTPGNYTADSTVIASITHAPTTTVEYKLTVEQISDEVIKQTVTTTEAPANVYQRTGDSSGTDWVFDDWVKEIKSTDYADAQNHTSGVVKVNPNYGITLTPNQELRINRAGLALVKVGTEPYNPITPAEQHNATFYGLTKAAGVDMKDSNNPVGIYTDEAKTAIKNMIGVEDLDVQINGTSIVEDGVANIPLATNSTPGVVAANPNFGTYMRGSDPKTIAVNFGSSGAIKAGTNDGAAISVLREHEATFYGLAKAAGDTTQSVSDNVVGDYTTEAKEAIQEMLDVPSTADKADVITTTASGLLVTITDGADNMPVKSLKVSFGPIQNGSGDPSPENVRAISGRNNLSVVKAGKNLYDAETYPLTSGWVHGGDGDIGNDPAYYCIRGYIPCVGLRGKTITLNHRPGGSNPGFAFYNNEKVFISGEKNNSRTADEPMTATVPSNACYYRFTVSANYLDEIQIELGSEATEYEPYRGVTASVNWTTEAGTVYGGMIDLVSGKLTVTHSLITISELSWIYNSDYARFGATIPKMIATKYPTRQVPLVCSTFKVIDDGRPYGEVPNNAIYGAGTPSSVYVHASGYTNVEDFVSAYGSQTILYELTEPVEYQLSTQEIRTLLGTNNFWSDGDNIGLEYSADTKSYLDKNTVSDVQLVGSSVVSNGIATIPRASYENFGVVRVNTDYGTQIVTSNSGSQNGVLYVSTATAAQIKSGEGQYRPIVPGNQYRSTFYGLAKAAGDVTQSTSNNEVGTYTDEAKTAINKMIGSYSLNSGEAIPTNADLNTYTTPGTYSADSTVIASITNAPTTTDTYKLVVETVSETIIEQIVTAANSKVYRRTGDSSSSTWVFTNWAKDITNTDYATDTEAGVVKIYGPNGISIDSNKQLAINYPSSTQIKNGTAYFRPIVPALQHESVFYGLAKASGDTTQALSDNAVGTYTNDAKTAIRTMLGTIGDVQMNGTSITSNGVANIPKATNGNFGVTKFNGDYGISANSSWDTPRINKASAALIKGGEQTYVPIVPANQHEATFYGLAKAAGDTTQSVSSNAVGTYTQEAKTAIQTMLGVTVPEAVGSCVEYISDSSVTIVGEPNTRYVCGEVTSIDITPPTVGTIDVTFTSGSTIAILTLPSTVKMPEWWGGVETGYTYELVITDGVYAGVMAWPQ